MESNNQPVCPICKGRIKIKRIDDKPKWAASCDCSYIEHAFMDGITLRLKKAAIKNQKRKEKTIDKQGAGNAETIRTWPALQSLKGPANLKF